ncbi:MAG: acyl carrier protein [Pseudomonadales bacterium]|nr:acyl carrier protein [Pseudomonadales bacterium]MCP5184448.1 acyl carrier protein [Pseudomonadales bacterium]
MIQTSDQQHLARLIVDLLNIDDVAPEDIDPDAILFDESGLGLDSIDALEIAVAIAENYGVHISAEDESTKEIFATLGNLTAHVMKESGRTSLAS